MGNMSRRRRKRILNLMMNRQVTKIRAYSANAFCSEPIQGFEIEYSVHRERIRRIQRAKNKILFAEFELYFLIFAEILKANRDKGKS
jgi:hypothetical protein